MALIQVKRVFASLTRVPTFEASVGSLDPANWTVLHTFAFKESIVTENIEIT